MLAAPRHSPGHLAENVMHFARVLRSAGMAVGTDRVQLTLQALRLAGFDSKRDFHAVLSTCMLDRIEHKDLFDQAFELFWRDPDLEGRMRAMLLPKVRAQQALQPEQRENRRLGDALFPNPRPDTPQPTRRRRDAVRRRLHGERPRGAAQGRLRHHECRRVARRAPRAGADALGVRAAADAARRALVPRRPHRLARPRCRRWRAMAANWASCAGGGRARCRRRWWCWPTSRAR